ncbi:hypothetical protein DFH29DRAFT_876804 [Suillus ampliporus]|nr:hypothetical protein DFH29DRAFT_876804 [Suillus ampliporus]
MHRPILTCEKHADNAQQAFSTDQGPTLHLALPALEVLWKAWSTRCGREKYADFQDGLTAGVAKISGYHEKSVDSNAYIIAMLLYPLQKANHIHQYWGEDLYHNALAHAKDIYYEEMYGNGVPKPAAVNTIIGGS